jgi:hypothetical protein
MKHKFTKEDAKYTERPNVKGFGCHRCEYGGEAKQADSEGRESWCSFWGMHIVPNACCAENEGDDDVNFTEAGGNIDVPVEKLEKPEKEANTKSYGTGTPLGGTPNVPEEEDEEDDQNVTAASKTATNFPVVPFEEWLQSNPDFMYGMEEDPERYDRQLLEWRYDENVAHFSTLKFPLTVYRAIEVRSGQKLNLDRVGTYWSWVEDSAQAYGGPSSMWSSEKAQGGEQHVMIKARIMSASDVDWAATLHANMLNEEENEITVKQGAQLHLLAINYGERYEKPPQKTITANHKVAGVLYHGTSAGNLNSLKKTGLQGNYAEDGRVWLTNDKSVAMSFGRDSAEADGADKFVVVTVDVSKIPKLKESDVEQHNGVYWAPRVPRKAIVEISTYDANSMQRLAAVEMHETPKSLPPRDDMRRHIDQDAQEEVMDGVMDGVSKPTPKARPKQIPGNIPINAASAVMTFPVFESWWDKIKRIPNALQNVEFEWADGLGVGNKALLLKYNGRTVGQLGFSFEQLERVLDGTLNKLLPQKDGDEIFDYIQNHKPISASGDEGYELIMRASSCPGCNSVKVKVGAAANECLDCGSFFHYSTT